VYQVPAEDYAFLLERVIDGKAVLDQLGESGMSLPDFTEVLANAGEFATGEIHPLNSIADTAGVTLDDGVVTTAPGFQQAYRGFVDAGWPAVSAPVAVGGDGLPHIFSNPLDELWSAGSASFALVRALTSGAVEAISAVGSDEIKATYLPALVEGRWTGTMNLTEPQAGTDLAAIRTMARPADDGSWTVKGQKIFITWGDHDLAENIVHVAVVGLPDEEWDERVHAVVVLKPGTTVTADDIRSHTKGLIAGYKAPRSVSFSQTLPLSGAGKVLKRTLKQQFEQQTAGAGEKQASSRTAPA